MKLMLESGHETLPAWLLSSYRYVSVGFRDLLVNMPGWFFACEGVGYAGFFGAFTAVALLVLISVGANIVQGASIRPNCCLDQVSNRAREEVLLPQPVPLSGSYRIL